MKVYEALANAFVKEGVTTVFGLMGNGNMYWWHTLDQHPDVDDPRDPARGHRADDGRGLGTRHRPGRASAP